VKQAWKLEINYLESESISPALHFNPFWAESELTHEVKSLPPDILNYNNVLNLQD
jgi:hypothetical protein